MARTFSGTYTTTQQLSAPSTDNPATVTATGLIDVNATSAYASGIDGASGFFWTLTNLGTVESIGSLGIGVDLSTGGIIANGAAGSTTPLIEGSAIGAEINGSAGTVSNYGTIVSTQTNGDAAVVLNAGGSVTNGASGLITGATNGVQITGGAGTVANFGTILGAATASLGGGVNLGAGGSILSNGASLSPGALIAGYGGVRISGPSSTLVNFGTVESIGTGFGAQGVDLLSGGALTNYGMVLGLNTDASGINAGFAADTITNDASGLIEGWLNGIDQFSSAGIVVNLGTVLSTNGDGVYLQAGGTVTNGSTSVATAAITGSSRGIDISSASGTIVNYGTILATKSGTAGTVNATGVNLGAGGTLTNLGTISVPSANNATAILFGRAGGTVINGTAGSTAGLITAYHTGVGFFVGTAGSAGTATITNYGTILSTQTGTAAGTGFTGWAVQMGTSATGIVSNFGTVMGAETNGGGAILMQAGGAIANDGLITAGAFGVDISGGAGTVTNFGTIASTATGTSGEAIFLGAGGTVTNYGLIIGARPPVTVGTGTGHAGVVTTATIGATVKNFGTITSNGTNDSTGINLLHGGVIVNGAAGNASALISGSQNGIYGGGHILSNGSLYSYPGAVGTVVNYGTIQNTNTTASDVRLVSGASVINHGLISSPDTGISLGGTAGTVVNFGTIAHTGAGTGGEAVYLGAGGIVTNYGLISGAHPGSPIIGTAGGYPGAVDAQKIPATVHNFGTITNPNYSNGINLIFGGTIINGSTAVTDATILAPHAGVAIGNTLGTPTGGAGLVFNYGTIENSGTNGNALALTSGGTVTNRGLISSGRDGISFGNTVGLPGTVGTVDNFGTIVSTAPTAFTAGYGIDLFAGGLIANAAGASVTALRSAISVGTGTTSAAATITNSGTVNGSAGISINLADTGANTIVNYGTIVGTGGIAVGLGSGDDQVVIEAGSSLNGAVGNFHPGDTFDLPFLSFSGSGTVTLGANNVLQIAESGSTFNIDLDPAQSFAGDFFHLASDSGGGTLVTESQTLIANGSFETPTVAVGGFQDFAVGSALLTGWTVFGPTETNVSIVSGSFAQNGVSFPAEDGTQWLDLTGDGSNSTEGVSQTVATVAGDRYQITYFVGNTTGGGIFGTTSTVDLLLNGAPAFTDTNSNVSPTTQNWQQFTHTFVATGASTTLAFQNGDPPGDNNNGLDNIALSDLGPASAGSKLAFFAGSQAVTLGLTPDGSNLPAPVAGDFNIEVFTATAGSLAAGYQAAVLVPGAVALDSNEVQSATGSEELLAGSYLVIDRTGGEALQIVGDAASGSSITVIGSLGDTIAGSTVAGNAQLIEAIPNPDAVSGPMTVIGGAGATTVWGGAGDSIAGGAGAILVDGHAGANDTIAGGGGAMTVYGAAGDSILGGAGALLVNEAQGLSGQENIAGGAGSLTVFDLGRSDTIGGSTGGTTFIDDSYGAGGGSLIAGGSGSAGTLADGENTFIKAAFGDTVTGGADLTLIDATAGGDSVLGGAGTVTGAMAGLSVAVNTLIEGGGGDTIVGGVGAGGAAATYIDASAGAQTITGGSGATTVLAGTGDAIAGGAGALQVVDPNAGGFGSIAGGTGNLTVFDIGPSDTITGSSAGTTFVNDAYPGAGGFSLITGGNGTVTGAINPAGGAPIGANTWIIGQAGDTIVGGSGNIYVDAGSGSESVTGGSSTLAVTIPSLETASGGTAIQGGNLDTITGGSGTLQLYINSDVGAETVNLGAGHGAAALRDIDDGAAGASTSVTGFNTATDLIQSRSAVDAQGVFLGTSQSDGSGGTILTFVDGSTMTLAGIASATAIKFTQ